MKIPPTAILKDKVALITGATGLIGTAIAESFAAAGAKVIINYAHNDQRALSMNQIGETIKFDVNDFEQSKKMFRQIEDRFKKLDILINNYGPVLYRNLGELDETEFRTNLFQNLLPVFFGCKIAGEIMIGQGSGGRIINIAAAGAEEIRPKKKTVPYYIAKNGVIMLTKSFAAEYAPYNITVNAVSPGLIEGSPDGETGSLKGEFNIPSGRKGLPDEVARVVLFLASPDSSYITGENINVDGGWSLT